MTLSKIEFMPASHFGPNISYLVIQFGNGNWEIFVRNGCEMPKLMVDQESLNEAMNRKRYERHVKYNIRADNYIKSILVDPLDKIDAE